MLNATITKRIEISEGLLIFHITPDGPLSQFKPGQYIALGLPGSHPRPPHFPSEENPPKPDKIIKRSYSIGSSPVQSAHLEFYIAIVPDGLLTSRMALLKEGDKLWMAPKIVGKFTTEEIPQGKNLVLVSTGTGIAPYISMLRTPEVRERIAKITLVHGVRYSSDLAYRQELLEVQENDPSFRYEAIVSRPGAEWSGSKGYVQKFFEDQTIEIDSNQDHVFLCGNPAMIDQMTDFLVDKGYSVHSTRNPGNLHLEKYW